jgi:drug/metabolite transporter (DMT)-like permease
LLNSQYFFGWCLMLTFVPFFEVKRLSLKSCGGVLLVGLSICLTSIFYGIAVERLPASIAIVLLFQFIWIGVILEAITRRVFPEKSKIIALVILLAGTLLASGVFQNSNKGEITTIGIVYGLLSAFFFALYIYLSGRVLTDVSAIKRSFYITMSIMIFLLIIYSPSFLFSGAISEGLWKYGILLGVFGTMIPITFFAIGIPKVGVGMGTILGGAELPAAVIAAQIILKEEVLLLQWVGILLILVGIILPLVRKGSENATR